MTRPSDWGREAASSSTIRIENLKPGDEILVSALQGFRVVSDVTVYPDGSVIVWYFRTGEFAYSKGVEYEPDRIVERGMIPQHTGTLVAAIKGHPSVAAEIQAEMLEQQEKHTGALERRAKWMSKK